jgi:hypothetical protein
MRFRARLLTILALGFASAVPGAFAQDSARVTVIELFTSQGCSSCPAADALLKTFSSRPETMALSLAVDYWDHLGWKDTLASPKNSARQKSYAKSLGTGNVYTPQVVVNGAWQAIGSNKADIEKAIFKASGAVSAQVVGLTAVSDTKRMTIEVGTAKDAVPATVWLAIVSPRVDVEIKRGENRGKMLAYHNVVRDITPVGMWSGKSMKIQLPLSAMMKDGDRCAVLLQADDGGRIIAAAWMTP